VEQVGSGTRNESMHLRQHRFDYRISNEGDISSRLLKEVSYCNEARDPTPVVDPTWKPELTHASNGWTATATRM